MRWKLLCREKEGPEVNVYKFELCSRRRSAWCCRETHEILCGPVFGAGFTG